MHLIAAKVVAVSFLKNARWSSISVAMLRLLHSRLVLGACRMWM